MRPYPYDSRFICRPSLHICSPYYTQQVTDVIYLQGFPEESYPIAFPSYIRILSTTVKNRMSDGIYGKGSLEEPLLVDLPTDTLGWLPFYITQLEDAARSTGGYPVSLQDATEIYAGQFLGDPREERMSRIRNMTILVSSLILQSIAPSASHLESNRLGQLLSAVHYLSIPSLVNAFSHFAALRLKPYLLPNTLTKLTPLAQSILGTINPAYIIKYLGKQLYLLILQESNTPESFFGERSIADYIGLFGQDIFNNQHVVLDGAGITSLYGTHLIKNDKILELRMNNNFILGNDIDPDFPPQPFYYLRLKSLELQHNRIQSLPETTFRSFESCSLLDLSRNRIRTLPLRIFNGFGTELNDIEDSIGIYLDHNQIESLSAGFFDNVFIRSLNLSYNNLSSLPENLFLRLESVQKVDIRYNNLHGTGFAIQFLTRLRPEATLKFSPQKIAPLGKRPSPFFPPELPAKRPRPI